jgi:hypothetical protein
MSQPVKLSDELVMDARLAGAQMQRSIAGQVEFWARMGRALERVSTGRQMERLQQRARLAAVLDSGPFPRFKAHPTLARAFIREEEDGTQSMGRFHHGKFERLTTKEAQGA